MSCNEAAELLEKVKVLAKVKTKDREFLLKVNSENILKYCKYLY